MYVVADDMDRTGLAPQVDVVSRYLENVVSFKGR
jgi:hypothetical protein